MISNIIFAYLFIGILSVIVGPLSRAIADEYNKVFRDGYKGVKPFLFRLTLSVLGILFWPLLVPLAWQHQKRPKPLLQELIELNSMMVELNKEGTDNDEIPGGKGEFGWSLDNPVPCNSIFGSRQYLNSLVDQEARKIEFVRIGSFQSKHVAMPIDGYKILIAGSEIGVLYISPYQKKNSEKIPTGLFKLL